jgi:hypothetical protein
MEEDQIQVEQNWRSAESDKYHIRDMIASGKWTDVSINHYTVWTDVRLFVNHNKDRVYRVEDH